MIEAKTQLAKLLATEDITVRHSTAASTASFDVKARVLTLPIWTVAEDMKDVLDMMTGHECAHALWTDMLDWEKAVLELNLHKGITNIVEDARQKYLLLIKITRNAHKSKYLIVSINAQRAHTKILNT